jgi:hypothetical protein
MIPNEVKGFLHLASAFACSKSVSSVQIGVKPLDAYSFQETIIPVSAKA